MTFVEKLVAIGSSPLGDDLTIALKGVCRGTERRFEELREMLTQRNGFYAFEGALHVFPEKVDNSYAQEISLSEWNAPNLWRFEYEHLTDGLCFFAEDIFGVQFAIKQDYVVSFDPESGGIQRIADDIERWAEVVLGDFELLTGFPLAHNWQQANGSLQRKKRLLPKVPFILGGPFTVDNLVAVDAVEGMRYRGDIWRQIRDLPEGAQLRLKALPVH